MRSRRDLERVRELAALGANHCTIARDTGVPRSTVRDWLGGNAPQWTIGCARSGHGIAHVTGRECRRCGWAKHDFAALPGPAYSYLLGMYLGDGYIASHAKKVYRLRIALDTRYPGIIELCREAMAAVVPGNRVLVQPHPIDNKVEVGAYSKSWPCLFPQFGPGVKHKRKIELTGWQTSHARENPREILRGLIHSDGCRFINRVNGGEYPRYMFNNLSEDILEIFCDFCDQLGVRWTRSYKWTISVARAPDVRRLDEFIGPKA